jgi:hypothetical protein
VLEIGDSAGHRRLFRSARFVSLGWLHVAVLVTLTLAQAQRPVLSACRFDATGRVPAQVDRRRRLPKRRSGRRPGLQGGRRELPDSISVKHTRYRPHRARPANSDQLPLPAHGVVFIMHAWSSSLDPAETLDLRGPLLGPMPTPGSSVSGPRRGPPVGQSLTSSRSSASR